LLEGMLVGARSKTRNEQGSAWADRFMCGLVTNYSGLLKIEALQKK
jgi:hypothetical protein